MSDYQTPEKQSFTEYIIKKSRFIAYAFPADSREVAMNHLASLRQKYPDARHHCWAYILGNPKSPKSAAMSDDGEPSGTAGKPILNVMQHKNVGDIMIVVVRYFGGIKLGAGGLVRAYSTATQQVYDALPTKTVSKTTKLTIVCSFGDEQRVRHLVALHHGEVSEITYSDKATLLTKIPEKSLSSFKQSLGNFHGIKIKGELEE